MRTIALIDPSPTARATLAAPLRSEFAVLESGTLTPEVVAAGATVIVAAADAVTPYVLREPPFAAIPCLILGTFPETAGRAAPIRVVDWPHEPSDLVAHVRAIVHYLNNPTGSHDAAPATVRWPFVPVTVMTTIERAVRAHLAQLPVLITGEPGVGKRTIARALHHLARLGALVRLTPLTATHLIDGRVVAGPPERAEAVTVLADHIDAFSAEAQAVLVECLDHGTLSPAGAARPFWLLATTAAEPRTLKDARRFDPSLAARLTEIVIEVPPLRRRARDIAPIARQVLTDLGSALGTPFTLAPDGASCLERHAWPGNLAELVAVLRRTAVLSAAPVVGGDAILFNMPGLEPGVARAAAPRCQPDELFGGQPGTRPGSAPASPPVSSAPESAVEPAPARLELILTELAHELRNPMVTIKTFAQHLPALLEDEELRQRFALLTDEAIMRMDGLLENVLEFARLGVPRPQTVSLTAVLDRTLGELVETLERRGARVRREGWDTMPIVVVDEGQLTYAMNNLFDSLAGELPRQRDLAVRLGDNGTIALRFAGTGGVTAKLQSYLCDNVEPRAATALPLRFVLARAVIVRNGGRVAVDAAGGDETLVTITLPRAPGRDLEPGGV